MTVVSLFGLGIFSSISIFPTINSLAQASRTPIQTPTVSSPPVLALGPPTPPQVGPAVGGPTVRTVSPNRVTVNGGAQITIKGTNFSTGATVQFTRVGAAAVSAGNVKVINSTTITATVPPGTGTVGVDVKIVGQPTGSKQTALTYIQPGSCLFFPTIWPLCQGDNNVREQHINDFYGGLGTFTFFDQVKSIYNGASSSTTIAADLTSLNFSNGMQMTIGTNVQAGSSGTIADVASGTVPTLAASGAGQAAQNMIYGGTFLVRAVVPVFAFGVQTNDPGGILGTLDVVLREGVDVQNFKSGTNANVTSPPSHSGAQMEGYLSYNSINFAPSSNIIAGQVFIGGTYGYSYTSHEYARDYGFGSVNRGVGQATAGVLINNVAKIAVSRGFGPSQHYIDSTSLLPVTVNNFKSWSFGIAYQTPPSTK